MARQVVTIDTHTHWIPEPMIDRLRSGSDWHGWHLEADSGGQALVSGSGVAPFSLDNMRETWEERIERRKREASIDVQAIMLPAFMWGYDLSGPDAASFCRDVNEAGADLARSYPDRVIPMGVLPLQDPVRTEREVAHCVEDLGITCFSIGSHVRGENLDSAGVAASLEAVLVAEAALMIHASYFNRAGEARMGRWDFGNSIGVPLEAGLAVMSLVYSGLLDKYPTARVGCCHGGGFSAYGIGRLWLRYLQGRDGGRLSEPPAHYLRRIYYDCLLHDDSSLGLLMDRVGATQIMVGTDYPYQGDMPQGSVSWILGLDSISDETKTKILEQNPSRFLGLAMDD